MKILGIDFGERRIGLAITEGEIAQPLRVEIKNEKSNIKIKELCEKENIEKIVIGISEGRIAEITKRFGYVLQQITNLPVEFFDETLTTQEAIRKMVESGTSREKRKKFQDAVSAALILQGYLDSQLGIDKR